MPIRGSRFAGGWSNATVIAPGSAEVLDVQLQAKSEMKIIIAARFTPGLYRQSARSNFNYGFAKLFDLAGNARLQVRAVAKGDELYAFFHLQDPIQRFIKASTKYGAFASLGKNRLERPLKQRSGLRKKQKIIAGLESPQKQVGRQADTGDGAHRQIVGDGESFVAEFLSKETVYEPM